MESYRPLAGWKTDISSDSSSASDPPPETVPTEEASQSVHVHKSKKDKRRGSDANRRGSKSSSNMEDLAPVGRSTQKIIDLARSKAKALKSERREQRRIRKEREIERLLQEAAEADEELFTDPLDAQFWFYDKQKSEWSSSAQKVRLAYEPFARGGMRWALKMQLIKEDGPVENWVAKVFREPHHSREYFSEALTQNVCEMYAEPFSQLIGYNDVNGEQQFRFLPVFVMKVNQGYWAMQKHPYGDLYCVEPFLSGTYEKFSDNMGRIFQTSGTWSETQLPHAFSHYTYEESGHLLCVTDLQGVKSWFTDPQIHTIDGSGFGRGNMAEEGIEMFKTTHQCTEICRALKLRALDEPSDDEEVLRKRDATTLKYTTAFMDKSGQIVLQNWTQPKRTADDS